MILSARPLDQVGGVNIFNYVDQVSATFGDTYNYYFQLIDLSQDLTNFGFKPVGRRWCPAIGATLSVSLNNIDDAKVVLRSAVQAFPLQDTSIWFVPILATDQVNGTVDMFLTLTEGSKITRGTAKAILAISLQGCL